MQLYLPVGSAKWFLPLGSAKLSLKRSWKWEPTPVVHWVSLVERREHRWRIFAK